MTPKGGTQWRIVCRKMLKEAGCQMLAEKKCIEVYEFPVAATQTR